MQSSWDSFLSTFRRKLTRVEGSWHLQLESSSRMVTLQTLSAWLLPHPHKKQQTQAAVIRNRRRRGDHWWRYPMWLGWVRTLGVFAGSSTSELSLSLGGLSAQCWPGSRIHYLLVSNPMWYNVSPAAAARSTLGRPDGDWRQDWRNTVMPVRGWWWRSQL